MVLRDKDTPPKLCFDNPVYDTDQTHQRNTENLSDKDETKEEEEEEEEPPQATSLSTEPQAPPTTTPTTLRTVRRCQSSISHRKCKDVVLEMVPNRLSKLRLSGLGPHTPMAAQTPESDFEEHIIENIRNRDFWSRRSKNNPFVRMRVSALVSSPANTPPSKCLQAPFRFPSAKRNVVSEVPPSPDEELLEAEVEEDSNPLFSQMAVEALEERRLRQNICWIRTYLTEVSEVEGGIFTISTFLSTMKNKELLSRWFSLWDVQGEGSLAQEEWVEDLKCSAREAGAREWAELLEVLAFVVCGEDADVTDDLFTTILTSKGVLEKLFRLINKDGDGRVSKQEIMDFIANLTYARPRTGFTRENLEWLEQLFRQALGHKKELSFDDFKKIVHSRNSFFAERVFQIFDRDNSGTVSLSEFLDAMHQFAGKSPNDKIKFLFKVYDLDGDGRIQRSELQKVIKACMEENGMKFSNEQIEDLTLALFEDADTQRTGAITYESLKAQLEKHDGLLENLSISIDRWLVPPNMRTDKESTFRNRVATLRPYQISLPYVKNNYVYLSFLLMYLAVNLGLFISRAVEYKAENGYTIVARACGQCLNFNCMFVLVLMLRQCITYLRSIGGSSFLPLDQHMYLHKICGWVIFILSIIHTVMHLINFSINVVTDTGEGGYNEKGYALWEWLLTMRPEKFGLIDGIANITGIFLIVILALMVICSQPFVRKSGYFEVFYWTHLLYTVFWALTIFHGPNFWKWFVAPGVIFLIERVTRTTRMRTGRGRTYISSGVLLPSKVIHLVIKRPVNFHFHPGDYVFVNIPTIAKYEWHPFTISSAPEQDDEVWLHIRAVGEWTNRLYGYFETEQQRCEKQRCNLQNHGNGLGVMVEDARDMKNLSALTRISKTPLPSTKEENSETASGAVSGLENGITNPAFEPDTNNSLRVNDTESTGGGNKVLALTANDQPSPDLPQQNLSKKKLLLKSCSVPDFNVKATKKESNMMLSNFRPASENSFSESALKEAQQTVLNDGGCGDDKFQRQMTRSVATSFRYMRRKPTIITLDLPSETDEDDDDEEEEEDLELNKTYASNRNTGELYVKTADKTATEESSDTAILTIENERVRRKSTQEEIRQRKISRQEEKRIRKQSRIEEVIAEGGCAVGKPLMILIDGPFGAPSSHIFRAQHAVLIATGIGVTPFASILKSIMHKYWKARHTCPKCTHSWTSALPQTVMNLRKVDFFWINRDQRSFEWFVNLLSQLEIEQAEQGGIMDRFLDMHMYITSALQKTDMKAVGLQLALDLLHEKEKRDLITGLKTRTNAGRPNWDKVFKQLLNQQKGKITVFYCGPPALARTLRYKCDEYGFDFRKEIF